MEQRQYLRRLEKQTAPSGPALRPPAHADDNDEQMAHSETVCIPERGQTFQSKSRQKMKRDQSGVRWIPFSNIKADETTTPNSHERCGRPGMWVKDYQELVWCIPGYAKYAKAGVVSDDRSGLGCAVLAIDSEVGWGDHDEDVFVDNHRLTMNALRTCEIRDDLTRNANWVHCTQCARDDSDSKKSDHVLVTMDGSLVANPSAATSGGRSGNVPSSMSTPEPSFNVTLASDWPMSSVHELTGQCAPVSVALPQVNDSSVGDCECIPPALRDKHPTDLAPLIRAHRENKPVLLVAHHSAKILPIRPAEKFFYIWLGMSRVSSSKRKYRVPPENPQAGKTQVEIQYQFTFVRQVPSQPSETSSLAPSVADMHSQDALMTDQESLLPARNADSDAWWIPDTSSDCCGLGNYSESAAHKDWLDNPLCAIACVLPPYFLLRNNPTPLEELLSVGRHCTRCGCAGVRRVLWAKECEHCRHPFDGTHEWSLLSDRKAVLPFVPPPVTPWQFERSKWKNNVQRTTYTIEEKLTVKYIVTFGFGPHLEEASQFHKEIQRNVQLERIGDFGLRRLTFETTLAEAHDKPALKTMKDIRDFMQYVAETYGEEQGCLIDQLSVLAFITDEGSAKTTPLSLSRSKDQRITIHCLGDTCEIGILPDALPKKKKGGNQKKWKDDSGKQGAISTVPESAASATAPVTPKPKRKSRKSKGNNEDVPMEVEITPSIDDSMNGVAPEQHKVGMEVQGDDEAHEEAEQAPKTMLKFARVGHSDVLMISGKECELTLKYQGFTILLVGTWSPS